MSITRRIAFGAAASWFSRGITIVIGLILVPVLFRHLPKQELGLWLLLGQSWAALGIFDFGFGATLTRRIAFAKGKSASDPNAPLTDEALVEISDLVTSGRLVYRALAVFAFVFSFSAGFFYLRSLHLDTASLWHVWFAWGLICLSQAVGVWANVWNCVLWGVGYVGWDAVFGSVFNVATVLGQITVVELGGGLVSLAVVATAGALFQRLVMLGFAQRRRPEIFAIRGRLNFPLLKGMLPLALRSWITALGGALMLNTDQFLIVGFRGMAAVPAYRAAFVIVHNLNTAAMIIPLSSQVFVSHLWQASELVRVHQLVGQNIRLGWIIMLTGAACLLVMGREFFQLWLGPGNFIGYAVLGAFLVSETLEVQTYVISGFSRATEDEAFAISSVAGGVAKLALSWLLAHWLGLFGIALGTVIGLLLTNQWYMTYRGLSRLKMRWREYARTVFLLCGTYFVLLMLVLFGVHSAVRDFSPAVQLASVASAGSFLFCLGVWFLVLDAAQRARVLRTFRASPGSRLA